MVQLSCHLLGWASLGEQLCFGRATLEIAIGHSSIEFRGSLGLENKSSHCIPGMRATPGDFCGKQAQAEPTLSTESQYCIFRELH